MDVPVGTGFPVNEKAGYASSRLYGQVSIWSIPFLLKIVFEIIPISSSKK